jgi:hypothetical protein
VVEVEEGEQSGPEASRVGGGTGGGEGGKGTGVGPVLDEAAVVPGVRQGSVTGFRAGVGVPLEHGEKAGTEAALELVAGAPVVAAEVEAGRAAGEEESVCAVVAKLLSGGWRNEAGGRQSRGDRKMSRRRGVVKGAQATVEDVAVGRSPNEVFERLGSGVSAGEDEVGFETAPQEREPLGIASASVIEDGEPGRSEGFDPGGAGGVRRRVK